MDFYSADKDAVIKHVGSSPNGLSSEEAGKRLAENGKNKLAEGKKKTLIRRFLEQFADPMIIVLLVAAALSGITAAFEHEAPTDVFIILFVVILNAVLGVIQESKAEEAIAALSEMTAAQSKVLRNGIITHVKSEDLVVGDVIILEAGDSVPADARLIECASLKVEEAALTGESVPVNKSEETLSGEDNVPLGDRKNMVYMGSTVVYGRGVAVICATGMDTEMGKIASALTAAREEATPLQVKLSQLSKILTYLVLGICVLVFAFGVIKAGEFTADVLIDTFMLAISLAVAAIPEGLAAVVTIVLSIGVTKMSKRNAVIRRLTAVETLGCTQIICSDKTGTLTQNKMTVVDDFTADRELLARAMALCSDAEIDADGKTEGEPTEAALVQFAFKNGLPKYDLKTAFPRINEAPFDSGRKMMSTVHSSDGGIIQYTKGAPDEVLKRCTHILAENGEARPMTDADREKVLSENKRMADKALRVLAAAYREHGEAPDDASPESLEMELTFIGIVGMIDPVRPEVKDAIAQCHTAGIRAVMITGDHKDTAVAIAEELGILTDPSEAITGAELDLLSDEQLFANIEKYSVYARVQPEHKVRIVKAWKALGKIVAMTGDGVNDAPSIKSADIGVGMGMTGTDVTKNVADMILGDDNFATIVSAVEEGRKIYSNIRKAIQFLLSSNLSEVISIFFATLFGFTILKPAHILWINLITDSLPALALGMEPGEEDAMKQPPRSSKDGIFAGGVAYDVIYQGFLVAVLTLVAYVLGCCMEDKVWAWSSFREFANWIEVPGGHNDGITMAFMTLSMAEIFHSFNMRSRHGSVLALKKQNIVLWGAAAAALALTTAVIYIPFISNMFEFTEISAGEYFTALGLAFLVIPIVECVKLVQRAVAGRRAA